MILDKNNFSLFLKVKKSRLHLWFSKSYQKEKKISLTQDEFLQIKHAKDTFF